MRYLALGVGIILLLLSGLVGAPQVQAGSALTNVKVCIDPGHGGRDPGAVNEAYGLHESEINLDVSYGLKALLEGEGATAVLTRSGDQYLTNSDRYTFCNAEAATILVSVHTNSTTDPEMDGSMALYFHRDDYALAEAIYNVMYPALRATAPDPANFTGYGLDRFASGVLLKSDMPAAMMEPLLMSHPGEASLLQVPIYTGSGSGVFSDGCVDYACRRGEIAQSLYQGVLSYFAAADNPPSTSITSPADGATFASGEAITFSGTAADAEDGDLTGNLIWTSSLDGEIGRGGSFTASLGDGNHTITAAVIDAAGNEGSATINISVGDSSGTSPISLSVTAYKVRGVQYADLVWSGATSAEVDVYRDGTLVATTTNDGAYTDSTGEKGPGSATYRVCEAGGRPCSDAVAVNW